MNETSDKVTLSFPASIDSLPLVRNFTADILHANGGSDKFLYRSEMVIDELCSNAIKFGSKLNFPRITITFLISPIMVTFSVENITGSDSDVENLKNDIHNLKEKSKTEITNKLGLNLVYLLSDELMVEQNSDGTTIVYSLRHWE